MVITPSIVFIMLSAGACFTASLMAYLNNKRGVIICGIVAIVLMAIAIHFK